MVVGVLDREMYGCYGVLIELHVFVPSLVPFTHSVNILSVCDRDRIKEFVCEFSSSTFVIRSSMRFPQKHAPRTAMFV